MAGGNGASRSVLPGTGVLALDGVTSADVRVSGVAMLIFGSRGRIGQYVPGTASFSSVGSWLAADESRGTGIGVKARPDHEMP
jgi:hypothetical protein